MNREIRVGMWKKVSQKGTTYCTGKFKIADKEYYLTLFNNDKKGNEKAPDFNLIIRDNINTQGETKTVEIPPKNKSEEDIYADFGNQLEYSEDDFPF